jgi:hypothetical protein
MKPLTTLLGLPVAGPLLGLGWLARRIAEAADREMYGPEAVQAALLALERRLDAGELDLESFEAEEVRLLAILQEPPGAQDETAEES